MGRGPLTAPGTQIELHKGDLPSGVLFGETVAVDTETTGLHPHRDRLCLVQLSAGDGICHLVHFPPASRCTSKLYQAPNLKRLLVDQQVTKLFHFARFDVGMLRRWLGVTCGPVYCTKIASKLVRTYTDRHSLKELCREMLEVDLMKEQQSSDWGSEVLTPEQLRYAAGDVLWLHQLREKLDLMLRREGRYDLAQACFAFVQHRAHLDLQGWEEQDIFAY